MSERQLHEAAKMFPAMDAKRYSELVESIRAHGLLHEIVLHGEKILDGRNRDRACAEAGVDSRFTTYDGDPFSYVWNANAERRDLSIEQRAAIWLEVNAQSEAWQARQREIQEQANRKRSEKQKGIAKAEKERASTTCGRSSAPRGKGTGEKAKASKTNRGAIERQATLRRERPDLAKKVRDGEMKPTAALRRMKKDAVAGKVTKLPKGKYRVIYADPPWQYNDERSGLGAGDSTGGVDRASTAARNHYDTMAKAELCALDVKTLAAKDSVLFCWATFPLLPGCLDVVAAWGFKYKTAFVWDKGRGSFGHYHTAEAELLLVCTRGSCTPDADKREKQIQRHPRAEHSRKPEEFRAMIDRLYPHGPRIELFRRGGLPKGWNAWGAEVEKEQVA